jgi:hypothetical protein
MSRLFLRNLTAQVGDSDEAVKIPNDFKIEIDINKRIEASAASGHITFFNLAANTKALIRDRGQRVRITGGYDKNLSLLHDGQIQRVEAQDEGVNRKTVVYIGAKVFKTTDAIFSKSYQGSVQVRQIVSDALPSFDVPYSKDILFKIPESATIANFSFSGRTIDMLDELLKPLNLQIFNQNNELLISEETKALSDDDSDVIVLNATSGLIKTALRTDRGVNITSLLNPRLQPGKIVKVESDVITDSSYRTDKVEQIATGFFKIVQTNFQGSNWDGPFICRLMCVPFGQNAG